MNIQLNIFAILDVLVFALILYRSGDITCDQAFDAFCVYVILIVIVATLTSILDKLLLRLVKRDGNTQ